MKNNANGNPGAVVFGNFFNYYQFHKAADRFTLLPADIWITESSTNEVYLVLDVGCNTGELTEQLWQHISANAENRKVFVLGIDLDTTLIQRAHENNKHLENIEYACVNVMDTLAFDNVIQSFLKKFKCTKFDAISCFSITMWIHLNHHDKGLQEFLQRLSALTELLLIEAQPWKCYQTAQRRLHCVGSEFPFFLKLEWRSNVEQMIDEFIQNQLGMRKVHESEKTRWNRSLLFYRHLK